jgi:hypothetical protein
MHPTKREGQTGLGDNDITPYYNDPCPGLDIRRVPEHLDVRQAEGELGSVILLRPPRPAQADYRHPLNYSYKHRKPLPTLVCSIAGFNGNNRDSECRGQILPIRPFHAKKMTGLSFSEIMNSTGLNVFGVT